MGYLDRLDRRFGRYAIENLTLYLIAGQSIFYVMGFLGKADPRQLILVAGNVLEGEWWRLLTFVFMPPAASPLFVLIGWYLFYMMGTALEEHWGALRYNLFLLGGIVLTMAASFLAPAAPFTNTYIGGSVFLAFAWLFPDFRLMLFFVLPVAIRWLALLTWLGYAVQFVAGSAATRLAVGAAVINFLFFFGRDMVLDLRYGKRKLVRRMANSGAEERPVRRCAVCGITDQTHPREDFRFCPQCRQGQVCYCQRHIGDHTHVKGSD